MTALRIPLLTVVAALACVGALAYAVLLPRQASLERGPAADLPGPSGWEWNVRVPGFRLGEEMPSVELDPVELDAAKLAATRQGLEADSLRVVVAARPGFDGVLAVLAAEPKHLAPSPCLAALLPGDAPVVWRCPASGGHKDLGNTAVVVAATEYERSSPERTGYPLYLAGVARGDVYRVVLEARGLPRETIYTRGGTWGEFMSAIVLPRPWDGRLLVFGREKLIDVVPLALAPGDARVLVS